MSDDKDQPEQLDIASVELSIFGEVVECHKRIVTRLRKATLTEEKQQVVLDHLKALTDAATVDMKQKEDPDLSKRLPWVAEQIERLIDELSE